MVREANNVDLNRSLCGHTAFNFFSPIGAKRHVPPAPTIKIAGFPPGFLLIFLYCVLYWGLFKCFQTRLKKVTQSLCHFCDEFMKTGNVLLIHLAPEDMTGGVGVIRVDVCT